MGNVFGFVGVISGFALIALVVAGIVAFHRDRLTFPTIVHTYTVFLLAVSIVLALSGGALLIKSVAGSAFGLDFSYRAAEYPQSEPPGATKPVPPPPTAAERAATEAGDDLTGGITLLVLGIGLGVAHAFGRAIAARRNTAYATVVERGFTIGMLVVGAVVGLASGALLLNDLLRRYVVTTATAAYDKPRPGGALGFAVLFIPLWIVFIRRVWRMLAQPDAAPPAPAPAPRPDATAE